MLGKRCVAPVWPRPLPRAIGEALRGKFFHKVLTMLTLYPKAPPVLVSDCSGGLKQGGLRLASLVLPPWDRRPGFRHPAARRQWVVAQQCDEQRHPALPKHPHQPQPGRPPRPGPARTPRRHVQQRPGGKRLVCRSARTEQPQRRDCHGQPPPRGPLRIAQACAVPLPPCALRDLQALFEPGAQPIPGRSTRRGWQIGQDQPRGLIACLPQGQQRTLQLSSRLVKRRAPGAPAGPGLRHEVLQGTQVRRPGGAKCAPGVESAARNGCALRDNCSASGRRVRPR